MGIAEAWADDERAELEFLVEVLGNEEAQHAAEDHNLRSLVVEVQREEDDK
jgi:hypothetical protein